jgi:hypothetical protein
MAGLKIETRPRLKSTRRSAWCAPKVVALFLMAALVPTAVGDVAAAADQPFPDPPVRGDPAEVEAEEEEIVWGEQEDLLLSQMLERKRGTCREECADGSPACTDGCQTFLQAEQDAEDSMDRDDGAAERARLIAEFETSGATSEEIAVMLEQKAALDAVFAEYPDITDAKLQQALEDEANGTGDATLDLLIKISEELLPTKWLDAAEDPLASLAEKFKGGPCNIPRVATLSPSDFDQHYKDVQPVIVSSGATGWPALSKWTPPYLHNEFGRHSVKSGGSLDIVNSGGTAQTENTFAQFLLTSREIASSEALNQTAEPEQVANPPYLFDRSILDTFPMLVADFSLPDFLKSNTVFETHVEHFIAVGGTGTGTVWHSHFPAWNAVVRGSKRWFLYPPGSPPPIEYPAWRPIQKWFDDVYTKKLAPTPGMAPLECTLGAGEVLYLPGGWYHATINMGETVAVSGQVLSAAAQGSTEPQQVVPEWLMLYLQVQAELSGNAGGSPSLEKDVQAERDARTLCKLAPSSEIYAMHSYTLLVLEKYDAALQTSRVAIRMSQTYTGSWLQFINVAMSIVKRAVRKNDHANHPDLMDDKERMHEDMLAAEATKQPPGFMGFDVIGRYQALLDEIEAAFDEIARIDPESMINGANPAGMADKFKELMASDGTKRLLK